MAASLSAFSAWREGFWGNLVSFIGVPLALQRLGQGSKE
jgi:hypothetical protein